MNPEPVAGRFGSFLWARDVIYCNLDGLVSVTERRTKKGV